MEYFIILLFAISLLLILGILSYTKVKDIKALAEKEELNTLTKDFPDNIEIAKDILAKLNNTGVTIEEDKQAQASLYIAVTNKIIIASGKNTFARVQTIAHECLHSVQDRKMLLFNFVYSNIYLLSFIVLAVLLALGVIPNGVLAILCFTLLSFVYYFIRSYLEMDAMTKAKYLAKEYMQEKEVTSKEKIEKLVEAFEQNNKIGIPYTIYKLFSNCMVKIILLAGICLIRTIF